MLKSIRNSLTLLTALTLILGIMYPCGITLVAQSVFREKANGSLIRDGERLVGSELIGQPFRGSQYFTGRPSATSPIPNNASASGGSNLGPLHPQLLTEVRDRIDALRLSGVVSAKIPVDLVTTSASGLDPHISPQAAEVQVVRVAKARGLSEEAVRSLVAQHTTPRQFGILGEPTVNVLTLNLALDKSMGLQK